MLTNYAKEELEQLTKQEETNDPEEKAWNNKVNKSILELIETLEKQKNSQEQTNCILAAFNKLTQMKPLTPLTGNDDEWIELDNGNYRNKRCPTVHKNNNHAWDNHAKIIKTKDGRYIQHPEKTIITFPYIPKTEIITE